MALSRRWSAVLLLAGVWAWVIWPRFGLVIWHNPRSWSDGAPTSFFWVHVAQVVGSLAIGTAVGLLGLRGWRAARKR